MLGTAGRRLNLERSRSSRATKVGRERERGGGRGEEDCGRLSRGGGGRAGVWAAAHSRNRGLALYGVERGPVRRK